MKELTMFGLAFALVAPLSAQTQIIIRHQDGADGTMRVDTLQLPDLAERMQSELRGAAITTVPGVQLERELAGVRAMVAPAITLTIPGRDPGDVRAMIAERLTPRFGVNLDYNARESDRYGAYVNGVTPGGPAEKAGIVAGDIITRIDGKSLGRDSKANGDEALPAVRATELISALTVGKAVDVEVRRGTQTKSLKVTPVDDANLVTAGRFAVSPQLMLNTRETPGVMITNVPETMPFGGLAEFMSGGNMAFDMGRTNLFSSFELAPMNEKLGAYFGTTEGVLVVNHLLERTNYWTNVTVEADSDATMSAPGNHVTAGGTTATRRIQPNGNGRVTLRATGMPAVAPVPLEPGDVIVSVDGRKVTSPSQLMRIVESYDRGDEFKLQIMRQKHAESISVKMP